MPKYYKIISFLLRAAKALAELLAIYLLIAGGSFIVASVLGWLLLEQEGYVTLNQLRGLLP